MNKLTTKVLLLATVVLTLTSCGNKKKQKEEIEVKKQEIAKVASNYVYPLPSSFEVADMLNEIEAAYILGITNPVENAENYSSDSKKALNLGVFLADLSYATIYKRKQTAEDYLSASESLIRSLRVDDALKDGLTSRIAAQLENRDTLIPMVTEATQTVYADLHQKGKKDLAYLMVAGAWTETMYLTLLVSENTPLNAKIIETIIFQHKSLLEVIKLMDEVNEEATISPIYTALKGIKNTFEKEDPSALTQEQVTQLTAKVNALRSQITE